MVSVRFGPVSVCSIGPVQFMCGSGSCSSWSVSVRFGVWIDICFSSGVGKANTDCFRPWVYSSGLLLFWAFEKCKSGASVPKEEHKLHYGHANVTRGISGRAFHEQRLSKNGES